MKALYLEVTTHLMIPFSECELSYVRSSGPGGQNVNKVNSKAVLRWSLLNSPSVDEATRLRLLAKLANKLNSDGEIIISSDVHRDQGQNREECFEKLKELLAQAAMIPKKRKKTKASYSSTLRAKASKKKHSEKKRFRSGRE